MAGSSESAKSGKCLEIMAATVDDLPSFLKRTLLADSVLEASSSGPSVAHLTEEACDRDERDNMRNEKHTRSPPSHPPYIDMVLDAIKVWLSCTCSFYETCAIISVHLAWRINTILVVSRARLTPNKNRLAHETSLAPSAYHAMIPLKFLL